MEEEKNINEESVVVEEAPKEVKKFNTLWVVVGVVVILLLGFMSIGGNATPENSEENVAAEEVTSGTSQPAPAASTGTKEIPPADILSVSYSSNGFSPTILEVNAGDSVTFVNNTNGTLWVTSKNHPTVPQQNYPEFDSGKSISPGGTYVFTFTKIGSWGYKNLNNDKHLGTIVVAPQNQQ
jgi:plastocyanin